ncbi:hypothetical protein FIBSPDRAFT_242273 [Athelia psychrophila]|uniref:DUF7918 domain-containing protein n=1 Tax=Athelia psychrophila TaxID=1759441 RepID=A0A165Y5J4_9AGAM|nr:hypothetical protein FIBSPDRAFT_242273 [Fibularhizoctonia sp. CBS 109695]
MPLELQGFKVWIALGGTEIACSGIEKRDDGKEVTCWVASEEGKEFTVNWTKPAHLAKTAMRGPVQVDDIKTGGMLMQEEHEAGFVYSARGLTISSTSFKPFVFGSLKLTDDDKFLDANPSTRLGDIMLSIWRVQVTSLKEAAQVTPPQEQHVHERTKKATMHRVKLGNETQSSGIIKKATTKDLDKHPIVTFVFKYRPLDVLKANGIVPTPVGTKRKASDEPKQEVSEDEVEGPDGDKTAEIKKLEKKLHTLRSKPSDSNKKTPKRVKAERLVPEGFVSGEVIDLTTRVKAEPLVPEGFVSGEIIDLT